MVRMHRLDMMSDVLGETLLLAWLELETAMWTIADEKRGIIVLLRESSNASLLTRSALL